MRLKRAEILGDWYVLDTTGTGCRGQPEGTLGEWTSVMEDLAEGIEPHFYRVGARFTPDDRVEFYSPRNAHGDSDCVSVLNDELVAMATFLKQEIVGGVVEIESVDQAQIAAAKDDDGA